MLVRRPTSCVIVFIEFIDIISVNFPPLFAKNGPFSRFFSNFSVSGSNPFRKPLPRLIMVKIREKHQKTPIFEITTFGGLFDKEKPR
tara:strand:- start:179 stop:439 length:261 start_codon:yes stop_codon:yes gene_type:complete